MKFIKDNLKFILVLILIMIILTIKFPYYIDAPGGISHMKDKIEIDGYKSKGSFNMTYVREYRATIPTLLISLFNKNWDVIKEEEVLLDNETAQDYSVRDKLFMEESISNAIYVAYKKAGKDIKIKSNESIVLYVDKESDTNIVAGDTILEIEDIKINSKLDITHIINNYDIGYKLNIKVKNNNKEYNRYAKIIEVEGNKKIGIILVTINKYETNPNIKTNFDDNESGSSGGLITALTIYNSLVKEDITKGLKIVGTGTLDIDGNVGTIGGVSYKLKSAEVKDGDLFLVPYGENYEEALKIKKEKGYKIKIIPVKTFDETIEYLKNM